VSPRLLTGKVLSVQENSVTLLTFLASGCVERTMPFDSAVQHRFLSPDGRIRPIPAAELETGMGMYAFLDGNAEAAQSRIVRTVCARFTPSEARPASQSSPGEDAGQRKWHLPC